MLIFVLVFPQKNFGKLDSPKLQQRYGGLIMTLHLTDRYALFHPFLFILRRCFYAAILVLWVERSYF